LRLEVFNLEQDILLFGIVWIFFPAISPTMWTDSLILA